MEKYTCVVIVGDEKRTTGFGARVTCNFSAEGLSNLEIFAKIREEIPDMYAASMPDGMLWDFGKGPRRYHETGDPIILDWLKEFKQPDDGTDWLAEARKNVKESIKNRGTFESGVLEKLTNPAKFYLDQDDDGHWFVVPVEKKEEFNAYVEQYQGDEYPENELPLPDGVEPLNGSYTLVTFENPVIE